MVKQKIGIIGFGNMGRVIAQGLLSKEIVPAEQLFVSDHELPVSTEEIHCTDNNKELALEADIIILAIRPQVMNEVLKEIKDSIRKNQLIISIAAGITIQNIQKTLAEKQPIIRTMPNLCAKIGESITAWTKNDHVSQEQEKISKEILGAIGEEIYIKNEDMINAFTAIAGSGPAYVFYLAELLEKAAMEFGFTQADSQTIVHQTLMGSIETLLRSSERPSSLRKQVTSKGGVTEAAFTEFEKGKLSEIFLAGINANKKRGDKLTI